MIDDLIGISDLPQRLAFVTLLLSGPPERSRRLVTRAGFFSPSLDEGLPLFELFNPSRRSSFGQPRSQQTILRLQRRYQRDQVFRGRHTLGVLFIIQFRNRNPPSQSR